MKDRLLNFPQNQSFFLFGARNTGKSTLIKHRFHDQPHLYIDLLDNKLTQKYQRDPQSLMAEVLALPEETQVVVIDEVQKIPALLDVVHALIEKTDKQFVLTGSSARKLRRGHANLLAGRAFLRNLYPFSFVELAEDFDLEKALQFGLLPKTWALIGDESRADFLRSYTHVYLKEEVWAEHLIRKLEPFQYFLEVAAQANGTLINASKMAQIVGVDDKSITQYFSILEDTLLGFHLPAFNRSFRKRLMQKSKFYFIDQGIVRALSRTLTLPVVERTYEFGLSFEHFVIVECYKLINYYFPDYRLSHLRAHDGMEIDLIVERPGLPLLAIEIKSASEIQGKHLKSLQNLAGFFDESVTLETVCFARVSSALSFDKTIVYPWREGVLKYFYPES